MAKRYVRNMEGSFDLAAAQQAHAVKLIGVYYTMAFDRPPNVADRDIPELVYRLAIECRAFLVEIGMLRVVEE